jgi:hypothetical protein
MYWANKSHTKPNYLFELGNGIAGAADDVAGFTVNTAEGTADLVVEVAKEAAVVIFDGIVTVDNAMRVALPSVVMPLTTATAVSFATSTTKSAVSSAVLTVKPATSSAAPAIPLPISSKIPAFANAMRGENLTNNWIQKDN